MHYENQPYYNNGDRFFFFPFLGPLLLGGIGGAALVGAARPRPVIVTPPYPAYPPMPYPPYQPQPYNYNYSSNYNYY